LVELAAVIAVAASVVAVLGPGLGQMRFQMRGVTSEGNLSTIGQIGAMYAVDNDDRIFTFTWHAGGQYINLKNGKTSTAPNDTVAAAWQVRNILHRATGRFTGSGRILSHQTRLVYRRYSHLVLADYLGGNVSDPMWADPADANLLHWQLNPLEYTMFRSSFPYSNGPPDQSGYDTNGSWPDTAIVQRWAFASSYQIVPHSWQPDFGAQYFPVDSTPHLFARTGAGVELGNRRFNEVRFPSAKVHMFEEFDREQAGSPYFAYDHAQSAKLMFDGSINTMMSGQSQSSVSPRDYLNGDKFVWEQYYLPLDTFPLPLSGLGERTLLNQRFRWTLGGLQGINYPQTLMRARR